MFVTPKSHGSWMVSGLAVITAFFLVQAGCTPVPAPDPQEGVVDVAIQDLAFEPKQVTLKRGESVRWTNRETSPIPHTTTSGNPGDDDAGALWDSETLQPGQSFTQRFDEAGTFVYFCEVHPTVPAMRDAQVIVEADAAAPVNTVALERVADGLTSPVGLVEPGDGSGRLFVVDQAGPIRIVDAEGRLLDEPFLDVSDRMVTLMPDFDERGLLGLAFHPRFADNGRFFIFYTAPKDDDDPEEFNAESHVSEFTVSPNDPDRADPASERLLLEVNKPQFNHNGGQLAFGPDGFLYVSVGDGGGADDVGVGHTPDTGNGQDRTTRLGKILRIDVDGGEPFGVPDDNPFVDDAEALGEIFALGLRNPWRFSFDTGGERRLFVADVGQNLFEEVNIVTSGGNYGWNVREGRHCFDPDAPGTPPEDCPAEDAAGGPFIDPIIEYPHLDAGGAPVATAVIGGYVYRGDALPGLAGEYVFGDFSAGFDAGDGTLYAAREDEDGAWTMRELAIEGRADGRLARFVLAFGQDQDGELYILNTDNVGPSGTTGTVDKIVPASSP